MEQVNQGSAKTSTCAVAARCMFNEHLWAGAGHGHKALSSKWPRSAPQAELLEVWQEVVFPAAEVHHLVAVAQKHKQPAGRGVIGW